MIKHLIVEIKTYTEHHNYNPQSKLTSYTINKIVAIQLKSLLKHSSLRRCYILVVTWALMIFLMCMPSGLWPSGLHVHVTTTITCYPCIKAINQLDFLTLRLLSVIHHYPTHYNSKLVDMSASPINGTSY